MFELKHRCQEMVDSAKAELKMDFKGEWVAKHGPSIRYIQFIFNEGSWVAHCDEYATLIEYCPFCGMTLPTEVRVG